MGERKGYFHGSLSEAIKQHFPGPFLHPITMATTLLVHIAV